MNEPFGGGGTEISKKDAVADAANRILFEIVLTNIHGSSVSDRFYVGALGYQSRVGPAFGGPLAGKELIPLSELGHAARIEKRARKVPDGAGGLVEQTVDFAVWLDPVADGATCMCEALRQAHQIIETWLRNHPQCFPPIVINITDGETTDGDPSAAAGALRALGSSDGNVLLFNLHISSQRAIPMEFPHSEQGLPDEHARRLFHMSNIFPDNMVARGQEDYNLQVGARGFVFNGNIESVIKLLDIGTRVAR